MFVATSLFAERIETEKITIQNDFVVASNATFGTATLDEETITNWPVSMVIGTNATSAYRGDNGYSDSNRINNLQSPYQAATVVTPADGTATIAYASGSLVSIVPTAPVTITFDNTDFGTQGVSRVGVEIYAGTNSVAFATATITNATAPTISTSAWSSIFFRRTADELWKGRQ